MVRPTDPQTRLVYTPPVDIYDATDALILIADIPGVAPESLDVCVQDNVLWIHGRVDRPSIDGFRSLLEESPPGDFARSFILSDEVDVENLRAELDDGVLTLTLPKPNRNESPAAN